jgi:hypothetical protein
MTLLTALVPPASAGAAVPAASQSVSITPSQVVVHFGADAAVVRRSPFQLRILDAAGAAALSEVANLKPAPDAVPPTMDLLPPGTDAPRARSCTRRCRSWSVTSPTPSTSAASGAAT